MLAPNQRGFDRAVAAGADEVAVFVSATEAFAARTWAPAVDGALEMAAPVISQARDRGLSVRGYVSMVFGDPWEGPVKAEQAAAVAAPAVRAGLHDDQPGRHDRRRYRRAGAAVLLDAVEPPACRWSQVALHFHDTYGQALANVLAGLEAGVREFDASAGGLGGCPFAKSATGNLATEDLVWMLDGLGIRPRGGPATRWCRPAGGWPSSWADPPRPGW